MQRDQSRERQSLKKGLTLVGELMMTGSCFREFWTITSHIIYFGYNSRFPRRHDRLCSWKLTDDIFVPPHFLFCFCFWTTLGGQYDNVQPGDSDSPSERRKGNGLQFQDSSSFFFFFVCLPWSRFFAIVGKHFYRKQQEQQQQRKHRWNKERVAPVALCHSHGFFFWAPLPNNWVSSSAATASSFLLIKFGLLSSFSWSWSVVTGFFFLVMLLFCCLCLCQLCF